tara:strand:- start:259 stop:498 length:240 start_codon:yes stop_codon:yes gene_type:complete
MNFKQKKDGSCVLHFSDEEIKIIHNKKSIHFTAEALRHFGNVLMRMVMEFNNNFEDDIAKLSTNNDSVIKGKNVNDNKS